MSKLYNASDLQKLRDKLPDAPESPEPPPRRGRFQIKIWSPQLGDCVTFDATPFGIEDILNVLYGEGGRVVRVSADEVEIYVPETERGYWIGRHGSVAYKLKRAYQASSVRIKSSDQPDQ